MYRILYNEVLSFGWDNLSVFLFRASFTGRFYTLYNHVCIGTNVNILLDGFTSL